MNHILNLSQPVFTREHCMRSGKTLQQKSSFLNENHENNDRVKKTSSRPWLLPAIIVGSLAVAGVTWANIRDANKLMDSHVLQGFNSTKLSEVEAGLAKYLDNDSPDAKAIMNDMDHLSNEAFDEPKNLRDKMYAKGLGILVGVG